MRMTPWMSAWVVLAIGLAGGAAVTAQDQAAAEASGGVKVELGPVFESEVGGIALRAPAGSKQIARGAEPDLVAEFVHDEKHWTLKVHRATFSRAMVLSRPDAPLDQRGILELTASSFASAQVGVEILRQDVINLGATEVGMLAMRYGPPGQRKLAQQAILSASDRVFYTLSFTSRTGVADGAADPETVDAKEREAVGVFGAVLDTVRVLDRRHIKEEQDERLRRTQALFVNFHERKLTEIAQKEQWLRLIRDGKDIGYLYVVEEPFVYGKDNGLLILVRSRTVPDEGLTVDGASSMWVSFDRRNEFWVSNALVDSGKPKKSKMSETGTAYQRVKNVRVAPPEPRPGERPSRDVPMKRVDEYLLTVERTLSGTEGSPLVRELPPYYLPQALGHLLPRLIPRDAAQGYLFVSWVSERQELMFRYVDVEREDEVDVFGQKQRAVAIHDRLGLQGTPTTHYVTRDGKYLGSRSAAQDADGKTVVSWILPTDAATLQAQGKGVQLTRPEVAVPERKEPKPNGR